ncbi:MAG: fumarylacetoacetate hydrolase family protein [Anaerolineales bacterium]|nr:fumarylacetoacetate hydrolase family protein [Anaerolineales bacterium]
MRFLEDKKSKEPKWGWISESQIGLIEGSPFFEFRRKPPDRRLESVSLLPPCRPSKIICVGRNYAAHAAEHDTEVPAIPLLFFKPPSSLVGHGAFIELPPQSEQIEHEAELAVVIGKAGRWIRPETAREYIFGYTIANDVTARDLQREDPQWTRAKGFDSFCPLGPWIETDLDPTDLLIACRVNGQIRQMASTHDMVFNLAHLIAYSSAIMSLQPGDIILTGTPAGVSRILDGDTVSIEIEGIGTLENPVRNAVLPPHLST